MRIKPLIIVGLALFSLNSDAVTCDRVEIPVSQTIDLTALAQYVGNVDLCTVTPEAIVCKDEKTGNHFCLKCPGNGKWQLLTDKVYRCSDISE